MKLEGDWFYDIKKGEIIITIHQIQNGEVVIEMPIEIGISFEGVQKIEKIQLKGKNSVHKIKVDQKPKEILFDPNLWVLMNSNFKVPYKKIE